MNSIRLLTLLVFISSVSFAEDKSGDKTANKSADPGIILPPGATPRAIHMLTRTNPKKFQHFYSIAPKEIENLTSSESVDPFGTYKYKGIVGYGSSKPGKGLVKLNRVILDNFATFYIKAPKRLNPNAISHPFPVWVWKRKGPGLAPVYASSGNGWRNVVLTTDKETLDRMMKTTTNLTRVRPKYHGVIFYVMPPGSVKTKDGETSDIFKPKKSGT